MFENSVLSNRLVPIFKPDFYRLMKLAKPYSMVSRKRMQNIWRFLYRVKRDNIPGDFVELGVANGGTAILLATAARRMSPQREVWLYDAFEDLGECDATYENTSQILFSKFGFDQDEVHLVKGWFNETLLDFPDHPISFLHVDASGYKAVKSGLELTLDKVSNGGWVVFDNYGVDEGCRRAVAEVAGIPEGDPRLVMQGHTQTYFQKTS